MTCNCIKIILSRHLFGSRDRITDRKGMLSNIVLVLRIAAIIALLVFLVARYIEKVKNPDTVTEFDSEKPYKLPIMKLCIYFSAIRNVSQSASCSIRSDSTKASASCDQYMTYSNSNACLTVNEAEQLQYIAEGDTIQFGLDVQWLSSSDTYNAVPLMELQLYTSEDPYSPDSVRFAASTDVLMTFTKSTFQKINSPKNVSFAMIPTVQTDGFNTCNAGRCSRRVRVEATCNDFTVRRLKQSLSQTATNFISDIGGLIGAVGTACFILETLITHMIFNQPSHMVSHGIREPILWIIDEELDRRAALASGSTPTTTTSASPSASASPGIAHIPMTTITTSPAKSTTSATSAVTSSATSSTSASTSATATTSTTSATSSISATSSAPSTSSTTATTSATSSTSTPSSKSATTP